MIDMLVRDKYMFDLLLSPQISEQTYRSRIDRNSVINEIGNQKLLV
jgi:hypothetical protein